MNVNFILRRILATTLVLFLTATAALASDVFDRRGSMKDAPEAPNTSDRPSCTANVALTTDYVFRGESQSDEHAAIQGGFDCDYRMFYAGVWASSIDFGALADIEVDVYGGIKYKWNKIEFDLGVIYYAYPDASDGGPLNELDYVEFKFGVSGDVTDRITVGGTLYYSDDYFSELGETFTYEGSVSIGLGTYGRFSPTFTALVGHIDFQEEIFGGADYTYWNAGIEIGFYEKFTLDLRYWDTDINGGVLTDERFVATVSATF